MGKIIVSMNGGLGNQMYEYACYLNLKEKFGEENVGISTSWFIANHAHYGYELEKVFGIKLEELDIKNAVQIPKGDAFYRGEYQNLPEDKDFLLTGSFCSTQMLSNVEQKLREDFNFSKELDDEFKETIEKITRNNSVSVHLRCGDFRFCGFDNTPITFYEDAIAEIKNKVEDPYFFIFSDDIHFAKEKFANLENKFFVESNRGENSYKDLFLMSKCKHFITATNSTFSSWGAWLSTNKDKIVLTFSCYAGGKEWGEDFSRKVDLVDKHTGGGMSQSVMLFTKNSVMRRNMLRLQCAPLRTMRAGR
ncbi:MAG: alpha-1,2-fucosyltransferase [Selenomonadaceae bacterium]|nr:alpha-1,2-fucosyltransferase [Selenomonadaceae bacterium]